VCGKVGWLNSTPNVIVVIGIMQRMCYFGVMIIVKTVTSDIVFSALILLFSCLVIRVSEL